MPPPEQNDFAHNEEVRVFVPDTAIKDMLRPHTFEQVIAPSIPAAEAIVEQARNPLMLAITAELERLETATMALSENAPNPSVMAEIIRAAFAIKSSAGLCGYSFGSRLARALYEFCELDCARNPTLSPRSREIIQLMVGGLATIFDHEITGDGGPTGAAIIDGLQQLSAALTI